MEVMVVNGVRYLLNVNSSAVDKIAETILAHYPSDALIEFDTPKTKDFKNVISI